MKIPLNTLIKSVLNVKDILEFADTVKIEDVKEILDRQITMNSAISDEGLRHAYGAQVGRTLLNEYGDDVKSAPAPMQLPVPMPV